jgi:hypothetical protein
VQTKVWNTFELQPEYLKIFNYLLSNTLAKKPDDRFKTSQELVDQIDGILEDFRKPPQKRKLNFKFKPSKMMITGTFLILMTLMGFILIQSINFTKTAFFMEINSLLEEPLNEQELAQTHSSKSKNQIGLLKIKRLPDFKDPIEIWLNGKLKATLYPQEVAFKPSASQQKQTKGKKERKKKEYIQFRVKANQPHLVLCKAPSLETEKITLTVKARHRTTFTCFTNRTP